jgi:hypothetical protein
MADGQSSGSTPEVSDVARIHDLELGQDLRFERRWWTVQRVSWCIMLAVVVAAVVGLLGDGPLGERKREEGALTIRYSSIARVLAPMVVEIEARPEALRRGELRLAIGREWLD